MKPISKIEFCNYKGISYLEIVACTPTGVATVRRELEDFMLNDGVLQNVEDFAKSVKAELNIEKMPAFELVLRTTGQFKTIVSLPTMSQSQASSLYYKEMRERGRFEKFVSTYNVYKHSLGYIFSTYYMSESVVKSLKILAKLLGSRVSAVTPYGFYLHKSLNTKGSFAYFHIRSGVCTMLLVSEGELISTYDFTFDNAEDIERQFLLVMSKHEFEFEHREITHYAIDSDVELTLDLGLELISLDDIPAPEPAPEEAEPTEKRSGLFGRKKKKAEPVPTEPQDTADATAEEPTEPAPVTEATAHLESVSTEGEGSTFADQLAQQLTEQLSAPEEDTEDESKVPALVAVLECENNDTATEQAPTEEVTEAAEDSKEPVEKSESTPRQKKSFISTIKSAFAKKHAKDKATNSISIIRARADVTLPTLDIDEDGAITKEELEAKRKSLIARTKEATSGGVNARGTDNFRARFRHSTEKVRLEFAQRAKEILKGEGMSYIVEEQATVFLYHGKYHSHIDIRNNEILYFTEE